MTEQIIDDLRSELSTTQLNCDMWHDRAEDMRNRLSVAQTEKTALCTRIDELCQEVEAEKQHNTKLRELVASYDSALHRMCNQMQGHVDCHDCVLGKDYSDDWCAIDELREAVYLMKVDLDD